MVARRLDSPLWDCDWDRQLRETQAEVTRLRLVLVQIQDWDALTQLDPRSDLPWLKRLIDNTLARPKNS